MGNANGEQQSTPASGHLQPSVPSERFIVGTVLFLTAITYLGTLRFDFVFDDYRQILFNPFIKAWHYVPQYFASSVWKHLSTSAPGNYYRPLFLLWLRVNYSIFVNRPLGWHLAAVALHLLVVWLTYILVRKMTGDLTVAWLAAIIFGVHPIHHEVVAWVSGMTESLFAIMFLASFLAYLQSLERSRAIWMTASCALFSLALLSKETAIVLPALVFAHGWVGRSSSQDEGRLEKADRFRRALTPVLFYLPIVFFYLSVRHWILSGLGQSVSQLSFVQWFLTLPTILLFYIQHWFFPVGFAESYDLLYQTKMSFAHVLLPGLIVIGFGVAIWILRKRLGTRTVGHAVAWILIPLLPALDTFVFKPDELVHDRYFYVPSIGAALLAALIIVRAASTRLGPFGQPLHVVVSGLALTLVLAFFASRAASFWVSDYVLFSRTHQVAPLNATAASSLAAEMVIRGDLPAAQALLEDGYSHHSDDYRIAFDLGRLQYAKHQYAKAAEYTRQAIALSPNFSDSYVSLGAIELKQGHPADAQESLRRAVEAGPYSAPAHTSYGIVLALNGDCTAAIQQFEAALALNPGEGLTELQLARCRTPVTTPAPVAMNPGQL